VTADIHELKRAREWGGRAGERDQLLDERRGQVRQVRTRQSATSVGRHWFHFAHRAYQWVRIKVVVKAEGNDTGIAMRITFALPKADAFQNFSQALIGIQATRSY
jgi:hypothetical protein